MKDYMPYRPAAFTSEQGLLVLLNCAANKCRSLFQQRQYDMSHALSSYGT